MNEAMLRPGFREGKWADLENEVRLRLLRFATDLLRFNRSQNLVSRVDPQREVAELVEESVSAALELGGREWVKCLDVGSGGGVPGLVLACIHPDRRIDLVERRRGRCDFLHRELQSLRLTNARVFESDVAGLYGGERYAVVTAKAVAEPGVIEGLCDPVVDEGGTLVLFQRAGWLRAGEPTPGGWIVERVWPGSFSSSGELRREGFSLRRS